MRGVKITTVRFRIWNTTCSLYLLPQNSSSRICILLIWIKVRSPPCRFHTMVVAVARLNVTSDVVSIMDQLTTFCHQQGITSPYEHHHHSISFHWTKR